ncbi:hypothetical protein VOLCADRAFT_100746 [Volvox carteri f. nagariensis]|uniref:Uncharacterized protein n=1 Tax=Volvox carteri f. nagariensis TaxID=3068 RepID=D8UKX6_VOLCA|nr:uncharacterized protein VOLCADRAFT_100746 [Volvox carteri f. nagariensis]EFJ39629.1 hypothetical protein VOLCADRAFT_100746 [Volvox carteri f. nagariensis]|eukprot:XP_002959313.1 hypothetical protein VOLCADRAFT_100746 [Volvox carteri f. nagariensis]
MGKKKAFINKKKAVTYSLVYRDPSEDPDGEDGGQRVLAPVGGPRGLHHTSDDYSDTYEYEDSVYDSEYTFSMSRSAAAHHDESYTLSEERRRELLALGFPDDGYDYLRHLRDLGRGNQQQFPHRGGAAAAAAAGGGRQLHSFVVRLSPSPPLPFGQLQCRAHDGCHLPALQLSTPHRGTP